MSEAMGSLCGIPENFSECPWVIKSSLREHSISLSLRDTFQEPQLMIETTDSIWPCLSLMVNSESRDRCTICSTEKAHIKLSPPRSAHSLENTLELLKSSIPLCWNYKNVIPFLGIYPKELNEICVKVFMIVVKATKET